MALIMVAAVLTHGLLMSQGLLMTAYMKWRGLPEAVLSLYRGAGAVSGIASTLVFPKLHKQLGALHASLSVNTSFFKSMQILCSHFLLGAPRLCTADNAPHSVDYSKGLL